MTDFIRTLTFIDTMYASKSVRVIPRVPMIVPKDMLGELPVPDGIYDNRASFFRN